MLFSTVYVPYLMCTYHMLWRPSASSSQSILPSLLMSNLSNKFWSLAVSWSPASMTPPPQTQSPERSRCSDQPAAETSRLTRHALLLPPLH